MAKHIIEEAQRCLQCKKPKCKEGCPVSTPLNEIISMLLKGHIKEAGETLFKNNPLSVICSLICPHEKFCEGHCILGKKDHPIQTSEIEHYISNYYLYNVDLQTKEKRKKKVAIIGAGPAGITVAILLATKGYDITIFDSEAKIGGILQYGIPEFRLPKAILYRLKDLMLKINIKIRPNILIGPVITVDSLFRDGYKAVFLGTGVWSPKPLQIKGESLGHVHYAINYLKNPRVYNLGKRLVVIGAGNVAMDVARTALRNGAREVYIMYRRDEEDMTAGKYEIEYAKLDGVLFLFYHSPVEIVEEGIVFARTKKISSGEGKSKIEVIKDSEELFPADSVIIAVSQGPQKNIVSSTTGIDVDEKLGQVLTNDKGITSRPGVFASGDVVTGAKTVVEAVNMSKKVALAIEEYLESHD